MLLAPNAPGRPPFPLPVLVRCVECRVCAENLTPLSSSLLWQVGVLMNNAAIAPKGTSWQGLENWHKVFNVNVFGCVHVIPILG